MFFILWVRKTQINAYARTGYLDASNLSQIATLSILYRDLINKTYQLSLPKILISSTYSQKTISRGGSLFNLLFFLVSFLFVSQNKSIF